ncbi:hypothetical protein HK104_001287 [Borealophlyctis nickersoniae]|nr:hypothetical protein HK104_001287 [Borealophlyctis nickersoniae]
MTHLLNILDRLLQENLQPPVSPFHPKPQQNKHQKSASRGSASGAGNGGGGAEQDSWVLIGGEFADLEAKDPRWFEIFVEYFLESSPDTNDDLLFFVRAAPSSVSATGEPEDPIFVKRKINNALPSLTDVVDWKQTFFLNLIVQLPCTLTVAICKKASDVEGERKKSLLGMPSEEKIYVVGGESGAAESGRGENGSGTLNDAAGEATDKAHNGSSSSSLPCSPSNDAATTPASAAASSGARKSRMIALRRVTKKVYAAPYKSRMDVKDAFMNECSFPLVYYTVNDYESRDLHLPICEREYLCVELSAIFPLPDSISPSSPTGPSPLEVPLDVDNSPFPVPAGHGKVVLFQGAVPFSALLDIYQQKGLAVQNQLRLSWSKLAHAGMGGDPTKGDIPVPQRTEYVMMRGPHGKGQCQVAITEPRAASAGDCDGRDAASGGLPKKATLTDRLKFLGNVVKTQIAAAAAAAGGTVDSDGAPKKPECLTGSMTYVNVPWQSIIRSVLAEFCKLEWIAADSAVQLTTQQ